MSDTRLFHTMQHFQTGSLTSARLDIEAWVRGVCSFSELADPQNQKEIRCDTHMMSSSPTKKMEQISSTTNNDDSSRQTRSMTQKGEGAGSKTVGFTVQEKPASTAASGYDLISKGPSSSLRTMTSSNETFATKSSSSKKKTVTKREDLALLNPKIQFRAFEEAEDCGMEFSQAIKDLWSRCESRSNAHIGEKPPVPLAAKDVRLIEDTLEHVIEMARKWRSATTEAHWIFAVVGPLLSLIGKLSVFNGKVKNSNDDIEVIDITTIEISPTHLCPYSRTSFYSDLDKRIDYAIGLSLSPSTLEILQNAAYNSTNKSINQTSTFCNFIPLFVNIEVKRRHVVKDPAIQLGSWIAAEFRKRLIEGWTDFARNGSLGSPVFAIEIETDAWLLYVVNAQLTQPKSRKPSNVGKQEGEVNSTEQDFKMCFFGPIRLGSTYSLDDTKRLVDNLCDICRWGQIEFKEWWQETILAACEE